jgi:hypothetical protein
LYLGWKGKLSGRKEEVQDAVGWPVTNGETFRRSRVEMGLAKH